MQGNQFGNLAGRESNEMLPGHVSPVTLGYGTRVCLQLIGEKVKHLLLFRDALSSERNAIRSVRNR